jgi:hypothetical protein
MNQKVDTMFFTKDLMRYHSLYDQYPPQILPRAREAIAQEKPPHEGALQGNAKEERRVATSQIITNPKGREDMKKDTLEEIVREFAEGFEWTNKDLALKEWLRRSLTSYRKDVLEEVLAAIRKCPDCDETAEQHVTDLLR